MSRILFEKFDKFIENGEYNKIVEKIKTLSANKRDYEVETYLARALNGQGKYQEAIDVLLSVEEQGKNDPLWHYRMGHNYYYLYDKEKALEYFKNSYSLAPNDIWTLFFLRKLNMKFDIYEDKKTFDTLKVEDFFDTEDSYETLFSIFNRDKVALSIIFEDELVLDERLEEIKENLKWLEENREKLEEKLLENGIISLAEKWASSGIPVDEEGKKCYLVEDNEKVCLPIEKEKFLKSLYPETVNVVFDEDKISMEVYFYCYPDYFAGHCIMVEIDSDKNICCSDLAE